MADDHGDDDDFEDDEPRTVKELIADLTAEDPQARVDAVMAIGDSDGEEAMEAIPALIKALSGDHVHLRFASAWALGEIGAATQDVIAALEKGAKSDEVDQVKQACKDALAELD
jgi:HEAT repeat protein